eukprot:gnl/MRDRNA2_/MRDRNA2_78406_c0_seq1.p2 gnl/MRDRNA2_/MRDRNA2_78406_c0~~gnl/MRDRNA2_/MRDRNA2_78406_c0_seq1.p2  ORF type:complete len:103 (-),score=12.59 gnl/MRDRNA2_/MRDRNA2_78406_c0_seq1:300-608(-)
MLVAASCGAHMDLQVERVPAECDFVLAPVCISIEKHLIMPALDKSSHWPEEFSIGLMHQVVSLPSIDLQDAWMYQNLQCLQVMLLHSIMKKQWEDWSPLCKP